LSSPLRTWITPGGKNLWASSTSFKPQYGVNGLLQSIVYFIAGMSATGGTTYEGLTMIVFPVRIAGAIFPHATITIQQWNWNQDSVFLHT
jgi:hypothetical protein